MNFICCDWYFNNDNVKKYFILTECKILKTRNKVYCLKDFQVHEMITPFIAFENDEYYSVEMLVENIFDSFYLYESVLISSYKFGQNLIKKNLIKKKINGIYHDKTIMDNSIFNSVREIINMNFVILHDKNHVNNSITVNSMSLSDYSEFIKNISFDDFVNKSVIKISSKIINNTNTAIIVFMGRCDQYILDSVIKSADVFKRDLYFIVTNVSTFNFVKNHGTVYMSKEFGNDILPSILLMDILNYKYYIKIHTKSDLKILKIGMDHLTKNPTEYLLNNMTNNISCSPKLMMKVSDDIFCHDRYIKYFTKTLDNFTTLSNVNMLFAHSSLFFTTKYNIDIIVKYIKENNYTEFFTNNCYDDNTINVNSHIHFVERLFSLTE